MAQEETEPGGDTEMFRAFVESEAKYESRPGHKGPLIVAALALVVAVIVFFVVINSR